jgi:hypothetical protein
MNADKTVNTDILRHLHTNVRIAVNVTVVTQVDGGMEVKETQKRESNDINRKI